jgi:hypothetical protein
MPRIAYDALEAFQNANSPKPIHEAVDEILPKSEADMPALDEEETAALTTLFSNLCAFSNLSPKAALAVLNSQDFAADEDDLTGRFRQGV